jgi:hypothetical protein
VALLEQELELMVAVVAVAQELQATETMLRV